MKWHPELLLSFPPSVNVSPVSPVSPVSSVSPADEEVSSLNMIKSAPVGPVAGGIMGCIMVLVLAVYAYRHQIHRRSHQHMSPLAAQGRNLHKVTQSSTDDNYVGKREAMVLVGCADSGSCLVLVFPSNQLLMYLSRLAAAPPLSHPHALFFSPPPL